MQGIFCLPLTFYNVHSVTSNAVYESMGIIWQGTVTMASDITSVYNWCKTHYVGSRVCGFRISSAGQASSVPFGTSSVTVIYCMSSTAYGWIQGLSDNASCSMAMAYINGTVGGWQKIIMNNFFGAVSTYLTDPIKAEIRNQFNNTAQYASFNGSTSSSYEGSWWGFKHSDYGSGIFISRGQFVAFYLDVNSFHTKVFMDNF